MNYLRKKLQAIMASADFKGYLREVTGTDSVTLTDCMGSDMTSLSLVGNAIQDGTPSPDNPVEIQGCGDRTANLFDISDFASTSSGYVENGEVYVTGYPYQPAITPEEFLAMTGLQEGDTFTTYGDLQILGTGTNSLNIQFAPRDAGTSAGLNHVVLTNAGKSKTSTIPVGFNSTNYYSLYIYAGGGDGLRGIWRNLMVVKGAPDERPPYEPYGYKIPIEVSGNGAPQMFNVYMDKPLYATGDVGDEIMLDFEHKTATRTDKTMLSEFNENAAWKYNGTAIGTYSCTFLIPVTPAREAYSAVMCNRFKKINTTSLSSADEESGVYEGGTINYIINHNLIGVTAGMTTTESIALWKSWLSGNNVKTLYQLLTPATTDISAMQDWDTIPKLWRGTATVSAETAVQPSSMAAKYYATKKDD